METMIILKMIVFIVTIAGTVVSIVRGHDPYHSRTRSSRCNCEPADFHYAQSPLPRAILARPWREAFDDYRLDLWFEIIHARSTNHHHR